MDKERRKDAAESFNFRVRREHFRWECVAVIELIDLVEIADESCYTVEFYENLRIPASGRKLDQSRTAPLTFRVAAIWQTAHCAPPFLQCPCRRSRRTVFFDPRKLGE